MKKVQYETDQNNPAIQAYIKAVEKGKKDQHVLPRENGWIIKNLLSEKISKLFNTQQEAIKYAEANARQGTTIFIHAQNGLIQDRRDY
ncbi:MAG TPA: DUF2188 domain-containing protein [Candidatus Saccharimonadales bacterium]|nr:DUF2188 domain-containing protein [Candidatus Saccharimonadales bacterium]